MQATGERIREGPKYLPTRLPDYLPPDFDLGALLTLQRPPTSQRRGTKKTETCTHPCCTAMHVSLDMLSFFPLSLHPSPSCFFNLYFFLLFPPSRLLLLLPQPRLATTLKQNNLPKLGWSHIAVESAIASAAAVSPFPARAGWYASRFFLPSCPPGPRTMHRG